jgi:hypothetical protein
MNIKNATKNAKVIYIKTDEEGRISSWNDQYIFVKFNEQLNKLGWEGTTSNACYPNDLKLVQ